MPINDMVSANLGVYDMYDMWVLYFDGKYVQFHKTFSGESDPLRLSVYSGKYTIHKFHMFPVWTVSTSQVNVCHD
mgnify:CR=1 FL=1